MGDLARRIAATAAVLLALGLASCGDDGSEPGSTTRPTATAQKPKSETAAERGADGGEAASQRDEGAKQAGGAGAGPSAPDSDDSGGGAEQFRVRGGDNSVQSFGSEAGDAEIDAAAAALHGFLDARAAGDWTAACQHLSSEVVESLQQLASRSSQGGKGCAELLRALSGGVPASVRREAAIADVGALRVEGEQAFLLYHGADDVDYAITMTEEDGTWKVASLAGVPLN